MPTKRPTKSPTKAQHRAAYKRLPVFLRELREEARLTQRELGRKLRQPQSWVYNCESGNRRVDVAEFRAWCEACGVVPEGALTKLRRS